jgi:hypothetical protein
MISSELPKNEPLCGQGPTPFLSIGPSTPAIEENRHNPYRLTGLKGCREIELWLKVKHEMWWSWGKWDLWGESSEFEARKAPE